VSGEAASVAARIEWFHERLRRLEGEIRSVIVGHDEQVRLVLIALFAGGHVLLEGVPGIGKTLLVRSLAAATRLSFSRIQFTPDLMPADVTGTEVLAEDRSFRFRRGPIFAHLVLADEINRATPKTQSALLEAMQERAVTVAGTRHALEEPFLVLGTQNPIEMEGTYPLPEAQLDRFLFHVAMAPPSPDEIVAIVERTTGTREPVPRAVMDRAEVLEARALVREVVVPAPVAHYAARLVAATHPQRPEAAEPARRHLRWGASPRAAQALILGGKARALMEGRPNVAFDDVRALALPALRHRVIRTFAAEAEGVSTETIVRGILETVPLPGT
jgi:MoxR-like ATPase